MAETVKRILDLMRAKDLSITDIAKRGGIHKSTVSNFLSGKRGVKVGARTMAGMALGLGTTPDYLLLKTNDPEPRDGSNPLPDFGLDVLEAMRRLPRARNYELLVIARSFIESQAQINALWAQEMKDYLLDYGDGIMGESAMNELLRRLDALGDGDASDGSGGTDSDEPDQPGEDDA